MMTLEEERILNEDVLDLFDKVDDVLAEYLYRYKFKHKDKAILAMLANVVGKYFCFYEDNGARADAIEIFLTIVEVHLKKDKE